MATGEIEARLISDLTPTHLNIHACPIFDSIDGNVKKQFALQRAYSKIPQYLEPNQIIDREVTQQNLSPQSVRKFEMCWIDDVRLKIPLGFSSIMGKI
jgi:hypothetical protein